MRTTYMDNNGFTRYEDNNGFAIGMNDNVPADRFTPIKKHAEYTADYEGKCLHEYCE